MEYKIIKQLRTIAFTSLMVLAFASCEEKRSSEIITKDEKGHKVADYKVEVVQGVPFRDQYEKESNDLKEKLDSLKLKIANSSKTTKKRAKEVVNKLEEERAHFNDHLDDDRLKKEWQRFKVRIDEAADSLDKRI